MDGVINALKPSGMTSHDVVYYIRKITNVKKVGHAGTLDPLAVGVLPILVGKATKLSDYLMEHTKTYRVHIYFGIQTTTYDCDGEIIGKNENLTLNYDSVNEAILSFVGEIFQTPPMYSAIKINGEKLYNAARKGKEIEIPMRKVTIYSIDNINQISSCEYSFDVKCSKGTYVRSLCVDIGNKLGVFAYMNMLIRLQTGSFKISDALTLEEIDENIQEALISPEMVLNFPKAFVKPEAYKHVINGLKQPIAFLEGFNYTKDDLVKLYDIDNKFIGVANIFTEENKKYFKVSTFLS